MLARIVSLLFFARAITAAPTATVKDASLVVKRAVETLADGSCLKSGEFSDTLRWQASGKLLELSDAAKLTSGISDGWEMYLPDEGALESERCSDSSEDGDDSSDRQRIEILSWPAAPAGETWLYRWKTFLVEGVSTSDNFFHMVQTLRRSGDGGPVVTLDAISDRAVVIDTVRGCDDCDSVHLSSYAGKTMIHSCIVKWGSNGYIAYRVYQKSHRTPLLAYDAEGDMGDDGSLKTGLYRAVIDGMSEARAYVGDFVSIQM